MKVLHIGKFFPPHRGGMETHLQLLASGLTKHVDVEVVVASDRAVSSDDDVNGLRVHRAATYGVVAATPMCPSLFSIVDRARADLVHIHHPHPLAMLAYLMSGSRVPVVVTYHSDIVKQRVLGKLISPLVHATLERSVAILVTSQEYLDSSSVLRRYRHKCHVVPLGVEVGNSGSVQRAAVDGIRERYGRRIVLAVGRLVAYKGLEHLVEAMARVDAQLLIIGDGPEYDSLSAQIARLGLSDRVALLGNIADTVPYYHACDVFVLPSTSRNEAFGIVQLEAMAAGKPVVNTDIGSGVTYVSPHGVTGLAVPPRDSEALTAAITQLLGDPALRRSFGEAGRRRAKTLFNSDAMVQGTLDVYRSVLGDMTPA